MDVSNKRATNDFLKLDMIDGKLDHKLTSQRFETYINNSKIGKEEKQKAIHPFKAIEVTQPVKSYKITIPFLNYEIQFSNTEKIIKTNNTKNNSVLNELNTIVQDAWFSNISDKQYKKPNNEKQKNFTQPIKFSPRAIVLKEEQLKNMPVHQINFTPRSVVMPLKKQ